MWQDMHVPQGTYFWKNKRLDNNNNLDDVWIDNL